MEITAFIAVLLCILAVAAISRRIQGTIITLPMVYTALGLLIGSQALGIVKMGLDNEIIQLIAELTLVLVLASDATRIDLKLLIRDHNLPIRLLGIGLPLTMIAGTLVAFVMFGELGFWGAAVLAMILSPTDASLGQSVVSNPRVPVRIRQALNIESGLNDGIAMPFLLLAISMAVAVDEKQPVDLFFLSASSQILLGVIVGVIIGWLEAQFINWGRRSGWMSSQFQKISAIALVLLTYGVAEVVGGNGFIAAFCLGMTFSYFIEQDSGEEMYEYVEVEVQALIMLTFLMFGAVMLPLALDSFNGMVVLYALISLTLVRMIPVAISSIGSSVKPITTAFVGWFGPRGTASIIYIYFVLDAEGLTGVDLIYEVVMITVLFSIILHGVTAAPGSNRYGKKMADEQFITSDAAEHKEVSEMPVRAAGVKSL